MAFPSVDDVFQKLHVHVVWKKKKSSESFRHAPTIWWQISLALVGEEGIDLPLGLELGRKLFDQDLNELWMLDLVNSLIAGVFDHLKSN